MNCWLWNVALDELGTKTIFKQLFLSTFNYGTFNYVGTMKCFSIFEHFMLRFQSQRWANNPGHLVSEKRKTSWCTAWMVQTLQATEATSPNLNSRCLFWLWDLWTQTSRVEQETLWNKSPRNIKCGPKHEIFSHWLLSRSVFRWRRHHKHLRTFSDKLVLLFFSHQLDSVVLKRCGVLKELNHM